MEKNSKYKALQIKKKKPIIPTMYIRSLRMSCRETAENKQILGKSQRNKITLKLHIFMYFNGQMVSKQKNQWCQNRAFI